MEYEDQEKAISIIKAVIKYVKLAHDSAECIHDTYGKHYMDGVQYEIMQETEALLAEMARIIDKFEYEIRQGAEALLAEMARKADKPKNP